jgi:NADPH:quinone reductase-like Zn-dependent oxidoreductase
LQTFLLKVAENDQLAKHPSPPRRRQRSPSTYQAEPGTRSKANRIHEYGGPDELRLETIPIPTYGEAQVLVHVTAAGVNGLDWKTREGLLKERMPLKFPATLGFEIAGVVVACGSRASKISVGDRVVALMPLMGAYADFVAVDESELCSTPANLSHVEAAALPVAALSGWQALEAGGGAHPGQKILVQGAAGPVGSFAVQFAKTAGATVIATASAADRERVLGLGADQVIDYQAERFEDKATNIDIVLDFVGGKTLDRSWAVLAPAGILVSVANPELPGGVPTGRRGVGLQLHKDPNGLQTHVNSVAAGSLTSTIAEVCKRPALAAALERTKTGHAAGKIVVDFAAE